MRQALQRWRGRREGERAGRRWARVKLPPLSASQSTALAGFLVTLLLALWDQVKNRLGW